MPWREVSGMKTEGSQRAETQQKGVLGEGKWFPASHRPPPMELHSGVLLGRSGEPERQV